MYSVQSYQNIKSITKPNNTKETNKQTNKQTNKKTSKETKENQRTKVIKAQTKI